MLCLDKDLYWAFIKLMSDKHMGRSYAGLLPYVEGLYQMGYITKEVYEVHVKRYSEPLATKAEIVTVSLEEKARRRELAKTDGILKGMIAQYELHCKDTTWLSKAGGFAAKHVDNLDSAKKLLALIGKATVQYVESEPTVQYNGGKANP